MFDDDFSLVGLPQILEQLGESVQYTPAGGDPIPLMAKVDAEQNSQQTDTQGRTQKRTREITICTNIASQFGGIADPQRQDEVTIDGEVWTVEDLLGRVGDSARLRLVRFETIERARPGYRQR